MACVSSDTSHMEYIVISITSTLHVRVTIIAADVSQSYCTHPNPVAEQNKAGSFSAFSNNPYFQILFIELRRPTYIEQLEQTLFGPTIIGQETNYLYWGQHIFQGLVMYGSSGSSIPVLLCLWQIAASLGMMNLCRAL